MMLSLLLLLGLATSCDGTSTIDTAATIDTVVLVVVDDLGFGDLGYAGTGIKTPTIDALALGGTRLNQYHVYRACTPTRAALLTSRYVIRYGLQSGVLQPAKAYGLFLNETTLPQRLGDDWSSHAIGKWHVGMYTWEHTPTFRGFDSYLGYYTGGGDYFTHQSFSGGMDMHDAGSPRCGKDCTRTAWETVGEYSTHLFTKRAQTIIEATPRDDKLFLYVAYQGVHCPAQVPDHYKAPYNFSDPQRNTFAGMLAAVDEGVANMTRTLRDAGRWDSTLFVFTSDNGAPTYECGGAQGGQSWPLRGGKCSAWNGGNRVPSFVHGPGVKKGHVLEDLAHVTDLGVTILSFVGKDIDDPRFFPVDGVNLKPALTGQNIVPARDTILLESDPYAFPLSGSGFGGDEHATPYYAARDRRFKLMIGDPGLPGITDAYYCTGPPCPPSHDNKANASTAPYNEKYTASSVLLFDLIDDPYESTNVAADHPLAVADLMRFIKALNDTAVSSKQQGMKADPRANPKNFNGTVTPWL